MQWRIVAGHPALDLANTVAPRPPGVIEEDLLDSPAAVVAWAERAGVIDRPEAARIEAAWIKPSRIEAAGNEPARPEAARPEAARPEAGDAMLADVLALRRLVDDVLRGERLDVLHERWVAAMGRSRLQRSGDGATLVVGADPAWMIGDRLADAIVDLIRHADLGRLRTCPLDAGGCGWYFLDRSRNQTRRWCTMDDCGTHAKSRRLTERRRSLAAEQRARA